MLYLIKSIRQVEQAAVVEYGISEQQLMANAGQQAFHIMKEHWPGLRSLLVLCGKGNNGGDGYVLAQHAKKAGIAVAVRQVGDLVGLPVVAAAALEECRRLDVPIKPFVADEIPVAELLVDALLGIGVTGEVRGDYRVAIEWMNKSGLPVMALDVPSGIDADRGAVLGVAARAKLTVTFIGLKLGLFTGVAVDHVGKVVLADLNLPAKLLASIKPDCFEIRQRELAAVLTARRRCAHKGDFGHVLIVGGNHGMTGAVRMAAEAALRVGAGLVSVATRVEHVNAITATLPEAMVHGVANHAELTDLIERATVIVLGPGLGQDVWSQRLFDQLIVTPKPLVLDADGLNLLAKLPAKNERWILTPHAGEAGRLLAVDTRVVQADRLNTVVQLQANYHGVCVLKGAGTLIKGASLPSICLHGNPGMATGGMGDVLSGIIGGLVAQGLTLENAANMGVLIHALAADESARAQGERGMRATDLMPEIRRFANP